MNSSDCFNTFSLISSIVIMLVFITACNPVEQYVPEINYHSPVDSTYKLLENLAYSYTGFELNEYLNCLHENYEFMYFSGTDTLSWGLDTEHSITDSLFSQACQIDLSLNGTQEYPWDEDTTGATMILLRDYSMKVYMHPAHSIEYSASGTAEFYCLQDSMGEWSLWRMWDHTESGAEGWTDIKLLFSP